MNTNFNIIYFFLFSFSILNAQQKFQKTFGGISFDFGYSVEQTNDKGFIVAGYTGSFGAGNRDLFVLKTDSNGTNAWSKTYGGFTDDQGYSIQQTNDGGYILTGYAKSFGSGGYDVYLVKINSVGDTLWSKVYGEIYNDFGNAVQQTTDGGYIIAGYTLNFVTSPDSGNAYLIRTDSLGNIKWTSSFGGTTQITDAYSVKQTSDKGFIITGYTNAFGELNGDVFLTKTDSGGIIIFTKTYGGKGVDWGNSVLQTNDGGYFIGGSNSTDSTGNDIDVFVIKTDANGDTIFTRSYGGNGYEFGQTVQQTSDGNYVIAGYTNSFGAGNYDAFLIKINSAGDTLFTKTYGGTDDDECNSAAKCSDGGFAIGGITKSYGTGNNDFYLIKTDSSGNSSCNENYFYSGGKNYMQNVNSVSMQPGTGTTITKTAQTIINGGGVLTDACVPSGILSSSGEIQSIKIFPNPNSGAFTFTGENILISDLTLKITNEFGKLVYFSSEKNKNNYFSGSINLQYLPSGIYFAEIISGENIFRDKIFIEK